MLRMARTRIASALLLTLAVSTPAPAGSGPFRALARRPAPQAASVVDGTWTVDLQPSPRGSQSTIYDPLRHRMLMFGGDEHSELQDAVWALDLDGQSIWTKLVTSGV